MKKTIAVLITLFIGFYVSAQQTETVTISGQVTDFDGNPVEGSIRYFHVRSCE